MASLETGTGYSTIFCACQNVVCHQLRECVRCNYVLYGNPEKMSILQAFYVLLTPVCTACEGSVFSHTVLSGGLIVSMFRVTPPHSAFPHTVELIPLISPSLCCYSLELS